MTEKVFNKNRVTPSVAAPGDTGWGRLGVVVSVVGRINEVNQHRARLVHDGFSGPEVLFKTCVAMKFVDDNDDDDDDR